MIFRVKYLFAAIKKHKTVVELVIKLNFWVDICLVDRRLHVIIILKINNDFNSVSRPADIFSQSNISAYWFNSHCVDQVVVEHTVVSSQNFRSHVAHRFKSLNTGSFSEYTGCTILCISKTPN